jgi:hypothetical protein
MAGRNSPVGECVESPAAPESSRSPNARLAIECPETRTYRRRRNASGSPVVVLLPLWLCCNALLHVVVAPPFALGTAAEDG